MPPKFANLKPKNVIRALEKGGFYIHETHDSHVQLKHPAKPGRITVPYHARFDIPRHIIRSIIKQAGLTNDEFEELLKKYSPVSARAGAAHKLGALRFGFERNFHLIAKRAARGPH